MKKLLLLILGVLILLPCKAQSFEYNGLVYNITSEDDRACEVGEGNLATGSIVIPGTVEYDSKTYTVTSIGDYAFSVCSGLTSIEIPNSVTSIGDYAFYCCFGLTGELVIPNSVTSIGDYAFLGCSGLTGELVIPNSVTSIGDYAFYHCSGLTSIEIPYSVTSIAEWAFYGCYGLTSLEIPNSVTKIEYSAFEGCSGLTSVVIGNSVTSIGERAFYGCSGLTSVVIPNSVTSIGDNAFSYCSGLTGELVIPNSVTSIGNYAFFGCSGLTSVVIGNSVTSIGNYAFYNCSGLTSVVIGNSVTSIGDYAFFRCSGLIKCAYPSSISCPFSNGVAVQYPVDSYINELGIIYNVEKTVLYYAPVTITGDYEIPNSVTKIEGFAFYKCDGFTEITIPESVTYIGRNAFFTGENLKTVRYNAKDCKFDNHDNDSIYYAFYPTVKNIEIGDKVKTIPQYFAAYFKEITSIKIPNSVTSIEARAFQACSSLRELVLEDGPEKLTFGTSEELGNYFLDCTSLETLYLGRDLVLWCYTNSRWTGSPFYSSTIQKVVFGPNFTELNSYLFYDCQSLSKVVIPNSVTTIGAYSFYGCSNLTSLYIGENVKSIDSNAFASSQLLEEIVCAAMIPPSAPKDIFSNFTYTYATLFVPERTLISYKNLDPWSNFFSFNTLEESGVDEVGMDTFETQYDVFNLNGQLVKRQASQSDIDALSPGIYIIGGKKVIVK